MRYAFESLTSISFLHTYFTGRSFSGLSVAPSVSTERVLQNYGILFKRSSSGFQLVFDTMAYGELRSRAEVLAAGLECEFFLTLQDRDFFNYTDLPGFDLRNMLFQFSNLQASGRKVKLSLHKKKYVSDEDLIAASELENLSFVKPFGVIRLFLLEDLPGQYTLSFNSKETYWRYILMGSDLHGLNDPAILDSSGAEVFEGPQDLDTPGGKGLAFKSLKPISLSDQAVKNFQLVENFNRESGRYKVVMRALPRADPNRFTLIPQKNTNPNEHINYSEIFIH